VLLEVAFGGEIIKKEYFDSIAGSWDEKVNHNLDFIKAVFQLLPEMDKPKILDVGSGTGILVPFIQDKYGREIGDVEITELDFSPEMIAEARAKFQSREDITEKNIRYEVQDIMNFAFPHRYDIILCYSVFPHFADKEKALNKLRRGLKPEGLLVIFHSSSREEINEMHQSLSDAPVKNDLLPSPDKITEMAQKARLERKYIEHNQNQDGEIDGEVVFEVDGVIDHEIDGGTDGQVDGVIDDEVKDGTDVGIDDEIKEEGFLMIFQPETQKTKNL